MDDSCLLHEVGTSTVRVRQLIERLASEFHVLQHKNDLVIQHNRKLQQMVSYQGLGAPIGAHSCSQLGEVLKEHQNIAEIPSNSSTPELASLSPVSPEKTTSTPRSALKEHRSLTEIDPSCISPELSARSPEKEVSTPRVTRVVLSDRQSRQEIARTRDGPEMSPFPYEKAMNTPRPEFSARAYSKCLTPKQSVSDAHTGLESIDTGNGHSTVLANTCKNGNNPNLARKSSRILRSIVGRTTNKKTHAWSPLLLDTIPAMIIISNAATISMSADIEPESNVWNVFEAVWVSFYLFEFILKAYLFGLHKYFCGQDWYWNWFDFFCLMLSLFDLSMQYIFKFISSPDGLTGLMKTLRLARLVRIVRALHYSFFDELKQMLLGVVSGLRVLFWAIVLLFVLIFFVGVGLNSVLGDKEEELSSVPKAMFSVFRCITDGCTTYNGTPLQERLFANYGAAFFFGYILFFIFVSVGIFNLIMAVFIDNMVQRSLKRRLVEIGLTAPRIEDRVKETLSNLIVEYALEHPEWSQTHKIHGSVHPGEDFDPTRLMSTDISISRDIFSEWLNSIQLSELLLDADIDTAVKSELFDVLDVDMGGELGLDELVTGLMRLRGPTTKADIIAVRLMVRYNTSMIEDILQTLTKGLSLSKDKAFDWQPDKLTQHKRKSTVAPGIALSAGRNTTVPRRTTLAVRNSGGLRTYI